MPLAHKLSRYPWNKATHYDVQGSNVIIQKNTRRRWTGSQENQPTFYPDSTLTLAMQQRLRNRIYSLACLLLSAASLSAHAVDYSLSGYGTIGYAQTDQDNTYQRFIDKDGGFKRDTVLGAQLSAQFNQIGRAHV